MAHALRSASVPLYVLLARWPTTITTNPAPPIIKPHLAPPLLRLLFRVINRERMPVRNSNGKRAFDSTWRTFEWRRASIDPSIHPSVRSFVRRFSVSPRSLSLTRLIDVWRTSCALIRTRTHQGIYFVNKVETVDYFCSRNVVAFEEHFDGVGWKLKYEISRKWHELIRYMFYVVLHGWIQQAILFSMVPPTRLESCRELLIIGEGRRKGSARG